MLAPGFVAKVVAVSDVGMRAFMVAQELATMPPAEAADAIAEAIRSSVGDRDAKSQAALLAIVIALGTNKFNYVTIEALYRASRAKRLDAVARMLLHLTASSDVPTNPERALRPNGRPLTLGERKSLARTRDRDVISLLSRDPNPDVVEILLGNPHLTERDVIRIAAHRPGLPSALRAVARHPRWLAAPHIRFALVCNPATEISLAIRLIATLPRHDIEAIAREAYLHGEVVRQAELVLHLATMPVELVN